jgi:DNA polymerase-3 subunit delta'
MFIGNVKAVEFLKKSIENGRLAHAYLFSGPENLGKFTLAKKFAQSLIKGRSLDLNIEVEKNLLDLMILEPEMEKKKGVIKEKEIKIEDVRNIQKDLMLFPFEGKYKVLIVNNANKMSSSSQNALLKILEEPNKTTIIILVTNEDSKILPTIKSRCQKVNFLLMDRGGMRKFFEEDLVLFSMGRPGLAYRFTDNPEELSERKKGFKELDDFFGMEINDRLKLAEKYSGDVVQAIKKMEFWIWILRSKALDSGDLNFKSTEKIVESIDKIKKTNSNARLVLENLFLNL